MKNNEYINEELKYVVDHEESEKEYDVSSGDPKYADNDLTRSVVDNYIRQIEDATGAKVVGVEGEATETDSELYFDLDDFKMVSVKYVFHPYSGKMTVTVSDFNDDKYPSKSYGTLTGNPDRSEDGEKYDREDDVYYMVKDIYNENRLIDKEHTHQILLPKESYDNEPYFSYWTDEKTEQTSVQFESEEAAQKWIDSLKIKVIKK